MRTRLLSTCTVLLAGFISLPGLAQDSVSVAGIEYPAPDIFEEDIQRFENADIKSPPTADAIVCIGSSSMRGWRAMIKDDLAPLSLIRRGFGGSNMNDALYYTDRIVLPYKPRAIVIYEGDNDVAQGIAPLKIADTFRAFIAKVHNKIPKCRIYFLSIKPSISRWSMWPKMKEANTLIAAECVKDKRLTFVDVASGMLDDNGDIHKEIYKEDKLHMTRSGYLIWRDILRPILLQGELPYESQKNGK